MKILEDDWIEKYFKVHQSSSNILQRLLLEDESSKIASTQSFYQKYK